MGAIPAGGSPARQHRARSVGDHDERDAIGSGSFAGVDHIAHRGRCTHVHRVSRRRNEHVDRTAGATFNIAVAATAHHVREIMASRRRRRGDATARNALRFTEVKRGVIATG